MPQSTAEHRRSTPTATKTPTPTPSPVISLTIVSPKDGATVDGGDVTVTIEVANFNVTDKSGQSNVAGEGHVHYFLDVEAPTAPGVPAVVDRGTWAYTATTTYTFTRVVDGPHTISVELINNDHTPLVPPVVDKISFTITNGYVPGSNDGTDGNTGAT